MSVVAVDDGYDFHVVVLDGTWVVRVPRRPACAEALDLLPEHLLCRDGRLVGELRRRARFYHRLAPWFGAHYEVFHGRTPSLGAVGSTL